MRALDLCCRGVSALIHCELRLARALAARVPEPVGRQMAAVWSHPAAATAFGAMGRSLGAFFDGVYRQFRE